MRPTRRPASGRATRHRAPDATPPMPLQIEVHKLGGTTIGSADRIRQAARLVTRPGAEHRVVVSSAMATVTNSLLEAAAYARTGDLAAARPVLARVRQLHADTIDALGLRARSDLVEAVRKNPLARIVRPGKLTLAALEASLTLFLDESVALREVPTLRMLQRELSEIA